MIQHRVCTASASVLLLLGGLTTVCAAEVPAPADQVATSIPSSTAGGATTATEPAPGPGLHATATVGGLHRQAESGNHLRLLVLHCLMWSAGHGSWPTSLIALRQQWRDTDALLIAPSDPTLKDPWCYVRPCREVPSRQPVVVEDPRCNRGSGSHVAWADGSISFVVGSALYTKALQLSVLMEHQAMGIPPDAWAPTYQVPADATSQMPPAPQAPFPVATPGCKAPAP